MIQVTIGWSGQFQSSEANIIKAAQGEWDGEFFIFFAPIIGASSGCAAAWLDEL
jgi:hypothetical protein